MNGRGTLYLVPAPLDFGCAAQAPLCRNASAACASGPEVGSLSPYRDSRETVLPMKLLTRLFQNVADT